ncbi:gliding motility-associated C-terminal domain-containing protein [Pedobacter sp. Leaf132]|uniref:gliding motility-associated C-terminal domain-containing protein n=1 Tax=Pedobacter sp. Leaf132 TaxID=2876557 RepID=UPI001E590481|nr:gliding motility-associated C-terminal domain-containing protein [Pedobacter sp. Leaf132]
MSKRLKSFIFLFLTLIYSNIFAQEVCKGALGDPVININFGSGSTQFAPPLSTANTNYNYLAGTPNDGQYTIAKSTNGMYNSTRGWHQIPNHTPNDPNGYMMIVNASNNPGIFYQAVIPNLCPNTTYEFSAWIINVLNYVENKPNITFTIETTSGNILHKYETKDIPESATPTWIQYATTFKTENQTDLVLKITNNGPGGGGNDIALDDITFRACGPVINTIINNGKSDISVCEGSITTYKLGANIIENYNNPAFVWQKYDGVNWQDIANETNSELNVNLTNAAVGVYKYRLLIAEQENIGSVNCRTASQPFTITVNPKLITIAVNSGKVCAGGTVQLSATNGESFSWTGPNGFTSNEKSPVLSNVQANMAGIYTVTATKDGCTASSSTEVTLEPPVVPINDKSVSTCEGQPIQLLVNGGTTYKWFPTTGLSDINISNPIATLKETTTYTITVSNGTCSATTTLTVNVLKNAVADAGNDLFTITGKGVVLNGKVSGDSVKYYWLPATYLDDATKLNPIATPPSDITYTLFAESTLGCLSSSDEMSVKVQPQINIPNTFSPNGDGINDFWTIPALDTFPDARIKITNRYGNLVYQNNGPYSPWNGKSQGKDLPTAAYYYTIYLNEDFPIFSGWVFIVR